MPFTPVLIFAGVVSRAVPRPLRCARDPRTRTAALHKVPLSLGRICSSGWHPRGVRPAAGLLSFTRRLPRIPCSLRGLEHGRHVHTRDWNPFTWTQAPERIGPRSAAILVRRMRTSRKSCCIRATTKPCCNNAPRKMNTGADAIGTSARDCFTCKCRIGQRRPPPPPRRPPPPAPRFCA